jgi:hypothetical protein
MDNSNNVGLLSNKEKKIAGNEEQKYYHDIEMNDL